MRKPLIIVLGANPAWQKTLFFSPFTPGKVNRAVKEENYPSGKGVNFCRALKNSGLAEFKLCQFAGGDNGRKHCCALERSGFAHETVITAGETRNCITCLDSSGEMTELIGVSSAVSPDESKEMLVRLSKLMPEASLFAIAGSLPDGSDPQLYADAIAAAHNSGIPILMDSLVKADTILHSDAKIILKVNQEEFFKITGTGDITAAHQKAASQYCGKIFAITNGSGQATLSDGDTIWHYTLPEIKVVNPLGAGDTASAVMSALIASGVPADDAFKTALASASANCTTTAAGDFSPQMAAEIAKKIRITSSKL